MKRTILSLTTAVALALPAYAQDNFDPVIADALQEYGYAEENIGTLTEAERAEIYTIATSGDQTELRRALAGMDLTEMGMPEDLANVEITADTEASVEEILTTNGYAAGSVDLLTQAEIANIYTTANASNETELMRVLDGLQLARVEGAEPATMAPDSTQAVIDYMQDRGYTQAEIAAVSEEEMVGIYAVMNSGDETEIERVIDGAINS